MTKTLEITGRKFGRLTVIDKNPIRSLSGAVMWNCLCDCGNTTIVAGYSLCRNDSKSCGCLQKELARDSKVTHGMTGNPEYMSWRGMIKRCTEVNNLDYENYGGRGITVCDRWLNSFEAFYEDMGPRPSPDHSIDRKDNNKGYYKENCRRATKIEQNSNKRNNVLYTYNGVTMTLMEWSKQYNVNYGKLHGRLVRGWNFEIALTAP